MNRLIKIKNKENVERPQGGYFTDSFLLEESNRGTYSDVMSDVYLRTLREIKCLLVMLIVIVLLAVLFKKG